MKHERIRTADHPDMPAVWKIYEASFPANERRLPEHQRLVAGHERYHLDVWRGDDEKVVGLTGWWGYDDFSFLEHFAVDPECRGGGYGTTILTEWMRWSHPVTLLEIDPVTDDISQRRFNFYTRLGYVKNPNEHGHVSYVDGRGFVPLWLLTWPGAIDVSESLVRRFERLQNDEMLFYFPFLKEFSHFS